MRAFPFRATNRAILPVLWRDSVLRLEFMGPLGLSAHALAKAMGVPTNRVTNILHVTRGITADTAQRLAKHFGTSCHAVVNRKTVF